jgi:hypothetical protein
VREAKGSVQGRETLDERAEIARRGCSGRSRSRSTAGRSMSAWTSSSTSSARAATWRTWTIRNGNGFWPKARALAERLGEPIPFRYVTDVQVARRLAAPYPLATADPLRGAHRPTCLPLDLMKRMRLSQGERAGRGRSWSARLPMQRLNTRCGVARPGSCGEPATKAFSGQPRSITRRPASPTWRAVVRCRRRGCVIASGACVS